MKYEVEKLKAANAELLTQNQIMQREGESRRSLLQQVKNKQLLPEVELAAELNAEYAVQSEALSGSGSRGQHQNRSGSIRSGGQRAVNRDVAGYFGLSNKYTREGGQTSSKWDSHS